MSMSMAETVAAVVAERNQLRAYAELSRKALERAREEIVWWVGEHGCCKGREQDALAEIDAALAGELRHQSCTQPGYVHEVPDRCDRIVWRGYYYHLPETPTSEFQVCNSAIALDAARAAVRYDEAIQQCADDPQKMSSFCTAEGDDLDALYSDWITKARAAVESVACNKQEAP